MLRRDNEYCPRCNTALRLIQRVSHIDMDKDNKKQEMTETHHCTQCSQKYEFRYALRSVAKNDSV
jgi:uncharacterized protein with PIN domain